MKHKIVITTPYPTDEEVIRILGISPLDVAYVDRLMVKLGLPKPVRRNARPRSVESRFAGGGHVSKLTDLKGIHRAEKTTPVCRLQTVPRRKTSHREMGIDRQDQSRP